MRVLLVGDLHANTAWLERAVVPAALRHDADLILQLGDFGWWPGQPSGDRFIEAAQRSPIPLWWIDGNHEHHDDLARRVDASENVGVPTAVDLGGNLTYLPRGTRIGFDGVGGVGCGGAHSIDRQLRNPGQSWFESERLSEADIARCTAGGHADILFSHDAPAGWEIPGLIPDEDLAPRLHAELASCWSHRARLAQVLDAATPSLVVHGHYHSGYSMTFDAAWGPVQVVGLDCDGSVGNLALLDCEDGAWTISPVEASR
jgi:Predicted phosphoesterases, related to the Icc protein